MNTLAFDIGGTEIKYAVCDENFNLTNKNSIPTNAHKGGKSIIERIIRIIKATPDINRIAVSTAGQVNSEKGEIIYATETIPGYTGTKIREIIEAETGLVAAVENDVNCAAIGEAEFGAAVGYESFICLTYGTGIGGAIFTGGKLYSGSTFSAGEFGHIIIHPNGNRCTCGADGCYETYASSRALIKLVENKTGKTMNGREIFANFSDPLIKSTIDEWIDEIIIGLKNLIYIFNPSIIVVGGGIMNEEYITCEINKKLQQILMPSYRNVIVKKADKGNDANLLGAAYLASKL